MNDVITDALESTGTVVRAVPADHWHRPTPCHDWDVHQVTNHLVGGIRIFAAEITGMPEVADHDSDWLGSDPVAAYGNAAAADRAAWQRPNSLSGTITISLGTMPAPLAAVIHLTEILVHGVDVAVAIDRADLVDQDQCAALLTAMEQLGGVDAYRVPGVFGPYVPTAVDDLPHRRLLTYLGRELPLHLSALAVPPPTLSTSIGRS